MSEFTDTLFTKDNVPVMQNPKILDFSSTYFPVSTSGNDVTVRNADRIRYLDTRIRRPSTSFGIGTYYFAINQREDSVIGIARAYLPTCTLKDLRISAICSSGSGTVTISILINENDDDTAIVKQLSVSTAYAHDKNIADTITMNYGDYITIKMVVAGAGNNVRECIVRIGMIL